MKEKMKKSLSLLLSVCLVLSLFIGNAYAAGKTFPDSAGHWAEDIINTLAEKGVIAGFPDGTVRPDSIITRGEFAALLVRYMEINTAGAEKKTPAFADIEGCWSETNIEALADAGIIDPADYGSVFKPNEPITRLEIIRMMVRSVNKGGAAERYTGSTSFADDSKLAASDKGYVYYANYYGLVTGFPDNTIRPDSESTRAEAFALLVRRDTALEKIKSESESSGGGSSYIPTPQFSFTLPESAYTGDEINITPTSANVSGVTWSAKKDGLPADLTELFDGTLSAAGGTVKPTQTGKLTLIATAENSRGVTITCEQTVAVYPVVTTALTLPQTAHTDTAVAVDLVTGNLGNNTVVWSVSRGGEAVDLSEAISGELGQAGGTVRFLSEGDYTLTASVTDELGKTVTTSASVTVYPVAEVKLSLLMAAHTDTTISLDTETKNAEGLVITYTLTRNGEAVDASDFIEGSFSGGSIRFKEKGVYAMTASVTDATRRVFSDTADIAVYPVGSAGFYLPEIFHTDKTVSVEAVFGEIGSHTAEWSLTRDGKEISLADATEGSLNNSGGTLRFYEKGSYVLKAEFTDDGGRTYRYEQGFTVYPVPAVSYILPEYAHTDSKIPISTEAVNLDGLTVEWLVDNTYGFQDWDTYVDGSLNNEGGIIRFKRAGVYELVARVTDEIGRVFLFETDGKCEVLPVLTIGFALPELAYTDTILDLRTHGNNNVLPVEWSVTRDGKSVSLTDTISGSLNAQGGKLTFLSDGEYILTASMTDFLGRSYTHSESIRILPVIQYDFTVSQTVHYGTEFAVITGNVQNLGSYAVVWALLKDGVPALYTGPLGNDGGRIAIRDTGAFTLIASITDSAGRVTTYSENVTVTNTAPNAPTVTSEQTRTVKDGKFLVNISAIAIDPDGDAVALEYEGMEPDGYYSVGIHTIKVRARDEAGAYSEWTEKSFTVTNASPTVTLTAAPTRTVQGGKFLVNVTAVASDMDGDPVTLEWDGTTAESYYSVGTHTIKVRARDEAGAYSEWTETIVTVTNASPTVILTATQTRTVKDGKFLVTVSAVAADADGDSTTLEWEGRTTDDYYAPGTNTVKVRAIDVAGAYSAWASQTFTIANSAPTVTITATPTRTVKDGNFLVNISATATDAEGDATTLEWVDTTVDSYYAAGTHTIRVRAKDATGMYSEWLEKTFTVINSAPTTPVISRTPSGNSVAPGMAVTITASSTDPDGDPVTLVWEGRNAETQTYPLGKNTVKVKAVDASGTESPWAAIVFFVADSSSGGGMTLTGPESVILENGLEGATITNYTFTVPPVDGHSGSDYGRVRGYNILTGQWDQLDYQTTTNGITFTRTLTAGVYSKLEFYYYTNHQCMYNKSNITYSVTYYFD